MQDAQPIHLSAKPFYYGYPYRPIVSLLEEVFHFRGRFAQDSIISQHHDYRGVLIILAVPSGWYRHTITSSYSEALEKIHLDVHTHSHSAQIWCPQYFPTVDIGIIMNMVLITLATKLKGQILTAPDLPSHSHTQHTLS